MTGKTPRPGSALHRLATERPLARRSIATAAAILGATSLAGCVKQRETAPGTIEKVSPASSEGITWQAHFTVGTDFDSSNLTVQEELERIVLLLDVTTSTAPSGSQDASATERSHEFRLANPRGKRPFVNAEGHDIPVA